MKGIKPFKLGFLTRPFQWGPSHHLGVSVIAYFPFEPAGQLLTEMELWQSITDLLGDSPVLDVGIPKARAEALVVGRAFQPGGRAAPTCPVRMKVGDIDKSLYAIGDRVWQRGVPSDPQPFVEMELSWTRAFGGEGFEPNPLGRGFAPVDDVHPLPNVETPGKLVSSPRDRPEPAGFGPLDFTWPQRMRMAGTYDRRWFETRYPGFAEDLDWRIWNMAPPDQQQEQPFRGDETLRFDNMHPSRPQLEARLPGLRARCFVTRKAAEGAGPLEEVELRLSTLWLFPHMERGVLVFQGAVAVAEDDAADLAHILVAGERLGEARPVEHYQAVLTKRLDPDNLIETLNDADLMPADLTGFGDELDRAMEMTKPERLREKRQHVYAAKEIEASRASVAALGLDPDEHGAQPLPPLEDSPSLSELPDYLREKMEEVEAFKLLAARERVERDAAAKAFFEEAGLDYAMIEREKETVPTGPPEFSADDYRALLRRMADEAAESGHPQAELEAYASEPEFYARLQQYEKQSLDGYRMGAHMQAPAPRLEGEAAERVRAEIERLHVSGEGFAERDLTGADLSGMDLAGADFRMALLESASFTDANLEGARFDGAVLAHADLSSARVHRACFAGANMGKARLRAVDSGGELDLSGATLWGADLDEAGLVGADLTGTILLEATLRGADLSRVEATKVFFHKVAMLGARFTGATLRSAVFLECDASELDFGGAVLEEAVFLRTNARGAAFLNAEMTSFRFVESRAEHADLRGARLAKANLRGAVLTGANLDGAILDGADLSEAQAEGARFYRVVARESRWMKTQLAGALMVSANLLGASLQKADLRGVDLRGANLYGADLALIRSDARTNVEDAIQLKVRARPMRPPS